MPRAPDLSRKPNSRVPSPPGTLKLGFLDRLCTCCTKLGVHPSIQRPVFGAIFRATLLPEFGPLLGDPSSGCAVNSWSLAWSSTMSNIVGNEDRISVEVVSN